MYYLAIFTARAGSRDRVAYWENIIVPVVGISMAREEAEMATSSKVATNILADSTDISYYIPYMLTRD